MKTPIHSDPLYTTPIRFGTFEIPPLDLLEHILATGGTGSGKTRSFLLPLMESVLERFGNESSSRAGMFLIDAKGDMGDMGAECVRRAGRTDTLHILGPGGNCWFPLFSQFAGDASRVANFLFEILEDRSGQGGGENESFWEENARRLLRAGAICAKARHGLDLGGLDGISAGINAIMDAHSPSDDEEPDEDESSCDKMRTILEEGFVQGRIGRRELEDTLDYVRRDVVGGNPRTWATISNMTRNYLAQFSMPALREIFEETPGKKRVGPEDVIDEGLLLLVSLSPVIYGQAAAPFRVAIKKAVFDRILQRDHLVTLEEGTPRPINRHRPILAVMDEFHTTLSARGTSCDAFFLDRAREFRCMCVLATQGISAISSVIPNTGLRNHLLNNCRTKFFFANDCPETIEYFEYIGGLEDRMVKTMTFQPAPAPPRFHLPNHEFAAPRPLILTSAGLAQDRCPRFRGSDLGSLRNGTALVVKKGRELVHYEKDPADYAIDHSQHEDRSPLPPN